MSSVSARLRSRGFVSRPERGVKSFGHAKRVEIGRRCNELARAEVGGLAPAFVRQVSEFRFRRAHGLE